MLLGIAAHVTASWAGICRPELFMIIFGLLLPVPLSQMFTMLGSPVFGQSMVPLIFGSIDLPSTRQANDTEVNVCHARPYFPSYS